MDITRTRTGWIQTNTPGTGEDTCIARAMKVYHEWYDKTLWHRMETGKILRIEDDIPENPETFYFPGNPGSQTDWWNHVRQGSFDNCAQLLDELIPPTVGPIPRIIMAGNGAALFSSSGKYLAKPDTFRASYSAAIAEAHRPAAKKAMALFNAAAEEMQIPVFNHRYTLEFPGKSSDVYHPTFLAIARWEDFEPGYLSQLFNQYPQQVERILDDKYAEILANPEGQYGEVKFDISRIWEENHKDHPGTTIKPWEEHNIRCTLEIWEKFTKLRPIHPQLLRRLTPTIIERFQGSGNSQRRSDFIHQWLQESTRQSQCAAYLVENAVALTGMLQENRADPENTVISQLFHRYGWDENDPAMGEWLADAIHTEFQENPGKKDSIKCQQWWGQVIASTIFGKDPTAPHKFWVRPFYAHASARPETPREILDPILAKLI